MSAAGPRLYIKTVANGLFRLIYVQELDGTEAFSHPIIKQLFPNPKECIGKKTDFVCRTSIIAATPRHTSKTLNIPISRKASDNKTFKAMVYVSIANSNAATYKQKFYRKQNKNLLLVEDILSHNYISHTTIHIHRHAQFLNESTSTNKIYQVAYDFDRTQPQRQCLDE
jgi:hypothetical protein